MNSSGLPNTVRLKVSTGGHYGEGRAAGAITPGHLLQRNGDNEFVVHAVAKGIAEKIFATEDVNVLQGKTIDDAFADNDLISYVTAIPGDEIYAWLKDGESVDEGDPLVSAGDGTLQKGAANTVAASGNAETLTIPANTIIGYANEALNLVGGAAAAGRLRIRVA